MQELKREIMEREKISAGSFDLALTNAQTKVFPQTHNSDVSSEILIAGAVRGRDGADPAELVGAGGPHPRQGDPQAAQDPVSCLEILSRWTMWKPGDIDSDCFKVLLEDFHEHQSVWSD